MLVRKCWDALATAQTTFFDGASKATQGDVLKPEDVGKKIVVIISEHQGETETVSGILTQVFNEDLFEVTDKWGNKSEWSRRNIKGFKFKGDSSG